MRSAAASIPLILAIGGSVAFAVDQPIDASKLLMKRTAKGQSLIFLSKDPDLIFPPIGSADDPASGTPGGVTVELFSQAEGTGSLAAPAGIGKPGWKVTDATIDSYKWVNPEAPGGPSPLKTIVIKSGKQLKLVARSVPLPLAVPQTSIGIRITIGSLRSCARFDPPSVANKVGAVLAKNAVATVLADCSDESLLSGGGGGCAGEETFDLIQSRIFNQKGCNVSTCHGQFTSAALDLRPGASYVQLVDVLANNAAAAAAGKKRVEPGNAAASFLSQKLHGTLGPDEGTQMPVVGGLLDASEIALVDAWIQGGAPQVGSVPGAPCLPEQPYVPAPALTPPPGGYQIVLNGPTLLPGQEQEGCMWVPVPNSTDFYASKWEFSLNPGTHHFAIFEWNHAGTPTTGVWRAGDFGCFSGAQFGNNITGSPQAPYYVDAYPPGVARRLTAGHYLGLNAHYYNTFDVPIQIKVWINIHPYPGTPAHVAQTIVDIDDTFGINIPPFTVQIFPPIGQPRARWTNTGAVDKNVIFLGGHMHYRGLRFTVWSASGTKLYESFDWGHPNSRVFTTPLAIPPGGYFDYECQYDNGVNKPVRTDGSGNPTNLIFGVSAEDAMCIITGSYYE